MADADFQKHATTMPPFYRGVRFLAHWSVRLYFYDIQVMGHENFPKSQPLILAANHPNSIMDTVLLATETPFRINYMARSGLFKNPIIRSVLNGVCVMPIYRASELAGQPVRKQSSFYRAYELLEAGGCIGMFPEGANSPDRQVRELKTGTARLALEAEARNAYRLGVQIQPVGLNFADRDRFLSSVLIRYGAPIDVRQFADLHRQDPRQAVYELTQLILERLRDVATHVHDERNHQLVMDIHRIYGNELLKEFMGAYDVDVRPLTHKLFDRVRAADGPRPDLDDRFTIEQAIADAVDYYEQRNPAMVARVRMDIRRYKDHLKQVRLRHDIVHEHSPENLSSRREAIKLTAYALGLGPLAIYGMLTNLVPYLLVRAIVSHQPEEAKRAFIALINSFYAFPLWYVFLGWYLWSSVSPPLWAMVLFISSLPLTAFFFLTWWRKILVYRDRILSRTLFRTQKNLLEDLSRERERLIETFENVKIDYLIARFGHLFDEDSAYALPWQPDLASPSMQVFPSAEESLPPEKDADTQTGVTPDTSPQFEEQQ
ncbi:hypothetical protein DV096_07270 [Bradymonadaceae bacterium TMQ3]|uniref:Phospholipid/glycerol acyltransferase domain-containing protein n=1 Tax=Lujinxingia sediminis TaxID=2480984 RepID=A0ABY0CTC0_9DELT|nr:1-acyl-sn-glycerol-3-phosphate acyltransferase [Lujinxingia sediminis]RDV38603.1 hypothetical protein DV096_07270 [Bradymonadaceae bacterium TMQ3]RVU44847.1 hypothetical protein EA187_09925 [Lujinxingia sediminis]TXC76626.1 hypothetical protein FRC91_07800 [Bradymonadales bacterium TMQ1]